MSLSSADAPPGSTTPWHYHFTPARIIGALVIVLAAVSLFLTTQYNHRQDRYVHCGGAAVAQTVRALQVRDAAEIKRAQAEKALLIARYNLLLILAKAENAPSITQPQAVLDYEGRANTYMASLDAYADAILSAPLPNASCLSRADRSAGGSR